MAAGSLIGNILQAARQNETTQELRKTKNDKKVLLEKLKQFHRAYLSMKNQTEELKRRYFELERRVSEEQKEHLEQYEKFVRENDRLKEENHRLRELLAQLKKSKEVVR